MFMAKTFLLCKSVQRFTALQRVSKVQTTCRYHQNVLSLFMLLLQGYWWFLPMEAILLELGKITMSFVAHSRT